MTRAAIRCVAAAVGSTRCLQRAVGAAALRLRLQHAQSFPRRGCLVAVRDRARFVIVSLVLLCMSAHVIQAAEPPPLLDDELDPQLIETIEFEDLFGIPIAPVQGVAGVPQPLLQTPSAVTVLTREDIRRTGHRSLAEALRLVPGMFVGRSESHTWRIGPRGFSGLLAPRNLVLRDGRTVYDPLHGGTFWEVQEVIFEDLDRIEVIRGPGATLWGANAVNGVINVITKSAHETQGLYISGGGGTYERAFTSVRYGDKISEDTAFRVYAKYFNRDRFRSGTAEAHDDWSMAFGGLRIDHKIDDNTTFTVQSEGYHAPTMGEFADGMASDRRISGAHVLLRLAHQLPDAEGNGWSVQAYYDRTNREQAAGRVRRDTFDIDFRHYFTWGNGHRFIWGIDNNFTSDRTQAGSISFDPRTRSLNLISAFLQNTFQIVPEQWFLMLGTKLHYHTYTGFDIQPSARLWWTPDEQQTFWAAVSRPVRIPSRLEEEGLFAGIDRTASSDLDVERLTAYELGYRTRISPELTADVALFYHDYSRLVVVVPPLPGPVTNRGSGESYGVELAIDWDVAENWRLGGGYSFVRQNVSGPGLDLESGTVPEHQAFIRSHLDITDDLFFDTVFYFYDHLPAAGVHSYGRLDVGFTWRAHSNVELSIWGQNLTDSSTAESSLAGEFPRGFYLMGTIRY